MDVIGRAVRRDGRPVREKLTSVLEDNDAIAEQAPALLRVAGYGVSRLAVGC
jgi:hypothetical protein